MLFKFLSNYDKGFKYDYMLCHCLFALSTCNMTIFFTLLHFVLYDVLTRLRSISSKFPYIFLTLYLYSIDFIDKSDLFDKNCITI